MNKSYGVTLNWTYEHLSMIVYKYISMSAYKYVNIQEYEYLRNQIHVPFTANHLRNQAQSLKNWSATTCNCMIINIKNQSS